ncbi:MAG: metal ABC transporter solute-binding protein, Zn/Mn family, partial [Thermodesulfobacteriota bacterium]
MKKIILLITVFFILPAFSYAKKTDVFVSILPQKYFAEKIGGEYTDVKVMVLPGNSPAVYNPTPGQMRDLGNAEIYFTIGVPFEKNWIGKIKKNFKNLKIKDSSKGIFKREPDKDVLNIKDHKNENSHNHDHGFNDPHVWMSPLNGLKIARNMLFVLIEHLPEHSNYFINNYKKFADEVKQLDAKLLNMTINAKNKDIFVYHPSWGYFMDDYGFNQIPIESEGKSPGPKHLAEIMRFAEEKKIELLLVQPQFPSSSADVMEKTLELKIQTADPL